MRLDEKGKRRKRFLQSRFRHLLAGFPAVQQATNWGDPGQHISYGLGDDLVILHISP
jgi:hypothetical protein